MRNEQPNMLRRPEAITIVIISDTHELHREVTIPPADILIHCGDFTMFSKSAGAILDFNAWLGELPHKWEIITPGNHEFFLEADPSRRRLISNATLLINESVEVAGLKIWGSPMTPLYGGAFGRSSAKDREGIYSQIPGDTDILVTHGPPYGVLDKASDSNDHAGCHQLLAAVRRIKPKLHAFGHVHGAYGTLSATDTLFVNATLPGQGFGMSNRPLLFRLPRR